MVVRRWLLLRMKKILLLLTMMLDTQQTKHSFPGGSAVQHVQFAVQICTVFLRVGNLNFQHEHISEQFNDSLVRGTTSLRQSSTSNVPDTDRMLLWLIVIETIGERLLLHEREMGSITRQH
jgi:hypothetical protein